MYETRTIQVVAAVIMSDDRFLVCRRAAGRSAAGQWEFPGGKVEDGEDSTAALQREVSEELGVLVQPGRSLIRSSTRVGDLVIDLECRWATLVDRKPVSSTDHDELRWARRDELTTFNWCPPDHEAVAVLAAGAKPLATTGSTAQLTTTVRTYADEPIDERVHGHTERQPFERWRSVTETKLRRSFPGGPQVCQRFGQQRLSLGR